MNRFVSEQVSGLAAEPLHEFTHVSEVTLKNMC